MNSISGPGLLPVMGGNPMNCPEIIISMPSDSEALPVVTHPTAIVPPKQVAKYVRRTPLDQSFDSKRGGRDVNGDMLPVIAENPDDKLYNPDISPEDSPDENSRRIDAARNQNSSSYGNLDHLQEIRLEIPAVNSSFSGNPTASTHSSAMAALNTPPQSSFRGEPERKSDFSEGDIQFHASNPRNLGVLVRADSALTNSSPSSVASSMLDLNVTPSQMVIDAQERLTLEYLASDKKPVAYTQANGKKLKKILKQIKKVNEGHTNTTAEKVVRSTCWSRCCKKEDQVEVLESDPKEYSESSNGCCAKLSSFKRHDLAVLCTATAGGLAAGFLASNPVAAAVVGAGITFGDHLITKYFSDSDAAVLSALTAQKIECEIELTLEFARLGRLLVDRYIDSTPDHPKVFDALVSTKPDFQQICARMILGMLEVKKLRNPGEKDNIGNIAKNLIVNEPALIKSLRKLGLESDKATEIVKQLTDQAATLIVREENPASVENIANPMVEYAEKQRTQQVTEIFLRAVSEARIIVATRKQLKKMAQKFNGLSGKISSLTRNQNTHEQSIQDLTANKDNVSTQIDSLVQGQNSLDAGIRKASSRLDDVDRTFSSLVSSQNSLEQGVRTHQNATDASIAEISHVQSLLYKSQKGVVQRQKNFIESSARDKTPKSENSASAPLMQIVLETPKDSRDSRPITSMMATESYQTQVFAQPDLSIAALRDKIHAKRSLSPAQNSLSHPQEWVSPLQKPSFMASSAAGFRQLPIGERLPVIQSELEQIRTEQSLSRSQDRQARLDVSRSRSNSQTRVYSSAPDSKRKAN